MPLTIYNTLSGKKEPFQPLIEGKVGMYVCGVTVYDLSHIGHARAAIVFDIIFRYLTYKGYEVTYARNYTDVDDKIINRAQKEGVSAQAATSRIRLGQLVTCALYRNPAYLAKVSACVDVMSGGREKSHHDWQQSQAEAQKAAVKLAALAALQDAQHGSERVQIEQLQGERAQLQRQTQDYQAELSNLIQFAPATLLSLKSSNNLNVPAPLLWLEADALP